MATGKIQVASNQNGLQSYFDEARAVLDLQIEGLKPVISKLRLHKQIEYALQTQGKRLRSTLLLLSGQSVGAERQRLQKLALGIELLHLATLVHDDILDQDLFRRNALSVPAKWSVKEAILVGDSLASLGLSLGRDYSTEVLEILANTCLQLPDGEYLDDKMKNPTSPEEYYFEKIKKKTASLFKAATECGAIAGNGSAEEINSLAEFGENYGLAFQIKDDLTDVLSTENILSDLNEYCTTLPLICLNRKHRKDAQIIIKNLLKAKKKNCEDIALISRELKSLLNQNGSIVYCGQKINYYCAKSISSLEGLDETIYKKYLIAMANSLKLNSSI
jgi:geranylgeranyl pyrophosphate synthase